jgi:PAS domain S-box-containing protein
MGNIKPSYEELLQRVEKLEKELSQKRLASTAASGEGQFYVNALNGLLTYIAVLQPDGTVLFVNDTPLKVAGITLEDIVGKKFYDSFWWSYSEQARRSVRHDVEQCAAGESLVHEIEILTENLSKMWIDFSMHPVLDEHGRVRYVVAEGRDVTERKQAEKQLQRTQEQLERAKKMEAIGLLAGGVAHDLNNVLGPITGYPELLLLDNSISSTQRQYIQAIKTSGEKAAAIVDDLLTIARGIAAKKEPIALQSSIADLLSSPEYNRLKVSKPHVKVHVTCEPGLFPILASQVHIHKVLFNLIMNAYDAVPENGRIDIVVKNVYLDHPIESYDKIRIGGYVMISIADNGPGIPDHIRKRIFEPFFTTKNLGRSGSGLGLAIVWNTVKEHDGYIDIESNENGTEFKLYFPIARKSISAATEFETESLQGNGQRILVIDDDMHARSITVDMLRHLGYEVAGVGNGETAVDYLKNTSVDLLILDMIMPHGMNGLETYLEIVKFRPHQKALIVSGYTKSDDVIKAQKLGAGKYVKKPYSLKEIALEVKKELEHKTHSK